jgi:DnaK suppressor protein
MSPQRLDEFRISLESRLKHLLKQGDHAVSDLVASSVQAAEAVESATLEADRNFRLRIRGRERNLIRKIRQAIARIEDGTFGICERCGGEISVKRLEARPVTSHCIDCKSRLEARERVLESPHY